MTSRPTTLTTGSTDTAPSHLVPVGIWLSCSICWGVTNATGMVGVVMPHGVLFRGGAEGKIRRGIVADDLFEAVIGLAPNLFFGASIPVAICVLNKSKPARTQGQGTVRGRSSGRLLPSG